LRGAGNQGMVLPMAEPVFFQHFQVERNPDGGLRELGRGAMGITYKAFDTNLHCPVALKIINSALTDDSNARERFLREARAAARLRHPNVATVLHLGQDGNGCFYAMEFIEGETLEAFVARKGPLPAALALEITTQIARALGAAQNEGLVHRDIKPANVMLARHQGEAEEEGVYVKVIDFGLAKFIEKGKRNLGSGALNLTMDGAFVGSPYFASPEQIEEGDIDTRSDIYSLGVTLWYMLTGEAPFTGSLGQIMAQHLQRPPPMEKLAARGVPETIRALLGQLLAKSREDRPADPAALRARLAECKRALDTSPPKLLTPELIAGRYAVLADLGEEDIGRLFKAEDRQAGGRLVAVRKLFPDMLANPQTAAEAGRAVSLAQLVPDPGLARIYALERLPEGDFLVSEWIEGFNLAALLRARGELDAAEAFTLLQKAAQTVDAAVERGLNQLDLRLPSIHVHFPGGLPAGADAAAHEPLKNWVPFELKISALELRPDARQTRSKNDRTLLPQRQQEAATGRRPVEGAAGMVWSLAEMVYELLGGALPPPGVPRYPPLAKLSEEANAALRQALLAGAAPPFADARQFAKALSTAGVDAGAASGSRAGLAPSSSTPGRVAAPPPLPPAPGQSSTVPPPVPPPQGPASSVHGGSSTFPPPLPPVPTPVKGSNPWLFALIGLAALAVLGIAAAAVLHLIQPKPKPALEPTTQSAGDAALAKMAPPGTPVGVRRALPVEPTPVPETIPAAADTPPPAPTPLPAYVPEPTPWPVRPRILPRLAYPQTPLFVYRTRLSAQDHLSSTGARLTTIPDILRQDRANFHRFGKADPEDESDPLFADARNRNFFDSLTFRGTREAFIQGTPLVEVAVFRGGRVLVTIISP
jgi:serine/threonine protein kinase